MSDATKISFRKKIALKLHRKLKKNKTKLHELNYIFWECTLSCNQNCLYCANQRNKRNPGQEIPVSDFIAVIDDVKKMVTPEKTMIVFTGGEPLIRDDIEQAGQELYNRGFPWGIVTNGILLTRQRLQSLISKGLRAVTIGLDGLSETHNWLRNNDQSFHNTLTAIKLVSSFSDIVSDVVTSINKRNFLEIDELKDLLVESGVSNWRIASIVPHGMTRPLPDLMLSPIQFNSLFEFIRKTRKEKKIWLNYGCQGFLGNYEGEVRDSFFFCRAGINVASILSDGTISACPNLNKNFAQGNIYTDNFIDVWKNRFSLFRNKSWTKKGECATCKWYPYCEGNSMHLYEEQNNTLLFCHLKNIIAGQPSRR
jgi:radical SAM enzyme (rSAM/lipoprotein system)